jgi:hypothetical protein
MSAPQDAAQRNLDERIRRNSYPGRGLVLGMDEAGDHLVQAYWIMGRSANSRNRVFCADGGSVWTEAADPAKMQDPALIIYNAMRELTGVYIVSNGDQTDTIFQTLAHGGTFEQALSTRNHEPDAPNYTPRISGVFDLRSGAPIAKLSVIKASPFGHAASVRCYFQVDRFAPGLGHAVTTYLGDGKPLPSFEGEPFLLPLTGDAEKIADLLWAALNPENRVALAVKTIAPLSGNSRVVLRNRFAKA